MVQDHHRDLNCIPVSQFIKLIVIEYAIRKIRITL